MTAMRIDIITIFPDYFAPLRISLIGKAAARGNIRVAVHDLRKWSGDAHGSVDDTPYGGGPGMIMTPGPWGEALDAVAPPATRPLPRLVVPTPSGALFTQQAAAGYAREPHLIFACGRYEGIDARVIDEASARMPVDEVSIGDYVLAGGEAAVLVMVEASCRLLPGVVGNARSIADDSFGGCGAPATSAATCLRAAVAAPGPVLATRSGPGRATGHQTGMAGLLEGPGYTKPRIWRGRQVPEVLLSGNHGAIARWRRDAALRRTALMRPELLRGIDPASLDEHDREVLSGAGFPVRSEDVAH